MFRSTLMLEYLPSSTRATISIAVQVFWSFGSIFEYLMGMIIVPLYGWRILTISSALPMIILVICVIVNYRTKPTLDVQLKLHFSLFLNLLDSTSPVDKSTKPKRFSNMWRKSIVDRYPKGNFMIFMLRFCH
jgi:MFS family permease